MNETLKGVAHIGAELAAAKADLQRELERHRKTWRQLEQVTGLLREATEAMNKAHDSMFEQCLSNPITNAWGKPVNTTHLNNLQDVALRAEAALSQQAEPVRCEYCDGTGDVHRADGEWLGECKECDAAEPAPAQDERAMQMLAELSRTPQDGEKVTRDRMAAICEVGHDRAAFAARLTRPAQTEQQPIYQMRPHDNVREWWDIHPDGYLAAKEIGTMETRVVYAAPIAQTAPQPEQSVLAEALETISRGVKRHFEQGKAPDMTTLSYWSGIAGAALPATPSPATATSHE